MFRSKSLPSRDLAELIALVRAAHDLGFTWRAWYAREGRQDLHFEMTDEVQFNSPRPAVQPIVDDELAAHADDEQRRRST